MSRVFWDSMLFIYLVEADPQYGLTVLDLLQRSARRGDRLFTSHLSVAETLVGLPQDGGKEIVFREVLNDLAFTFAEFDGACVQPFRTLRRNFGLQQPDALNLACASAVGVDIFLTNNGELLRKKLIVPGVHFIANFAKAPL